MVGEEIGINDHLAANGIEPIETDLGEYIIQLRGEAPSHIIAPVGARHQGPGRGDLPQGPHRPRPQPQPQRAVEPAARGAGQAARALHRGGCRHHRRQFPDRRQRHHHHRHQRGQRRPDADPAAHPHRAGGHREDRAAASRMPACCCALLARSATGQEMSAYTTFSTGPRRPEDVDGPEQFHVVLVDNGRSKLLGTEFEEMLRCIRCGACLNHCPIYHNVGGHAYGWVYAGPIGAITTPAHDRHRAFRAAAGGLVAVRALRVRLSGADSDSEDAACLARGSVRTPPARQPCALGAEAVGGAGDAARPLSAGDARGRGRARRARRASAGASHRCRSPRHGPQHRDLPAPQGRTFMAMYRGKK